MTESHEVHESTAREQTRRSGGCGGKVLLAAIAGLLVYAGWDAYQGRQVVQTQALRAGGQGDGRRAAWPGGCWWRHRAGSFRCWGPLRSSGGLSWCWRCGQRGSVCVRCAAYGVCEVSAGGVGACG
jgi:hypothetical protein